MTEDAPALRMLLSVQTLRAELDGMSVKALRERAGQEGCSGERLRHTLCNVHRQAEQEDRTRGF
jgi:hypothetical protein